ncbi:MAG: PaaI family thioesterase [Cyclobacteriaceae bacterium]
MDDFKRRVFEGFNSQTFMHHIGAELTAVEEGFIQIELPFDDRLLQQHGLFHGGVVATLADNAGGFAGHTLMDENQQPLSIEFKINLLNPSRGERLIARARVIKNGRRIKVCEVNIHALNGEKETHCALAIVSVIATEQTLNRGR